MDCEFCLTPDAEDKRKPRPFSWWRSLLLMPCYKVVCRGCGATLAWKFREKAKKGRGVVV